MIIGLDIDNVISDYENGMIRAMLEDDVNKRNAGIINLNARNFLDGMFDWTKEEIKAFFLEKTDEVCQNLELRKGAKKYIDKLIEDGHQIVLITYRAYPEHKNPYGNTVKWLKNKGINYHELVLSQEADKSIECKKHNIDVMFDDRQSYCKQMREKGVNCYLMFHKYNRDNRYNLPYAQNWKHVYEIVCELDNQKGKS